MYAHPRRVAFVTQPRRPDLTGDDALAVPALAGLGIAVVAAVWDDPGVDWEGFDLVVLRSPWDYHFRPADFLAWIAAREAAGARVWNPPALVRWNHHKGYLVELAAAGVATVPTRLVRRGTSPPGPLSLAGEGEREAEVVVKPAIGADAWGAFRAAPPFTDEHRERFRQAVAVADVLVQPYLPEVATAGELSLVFFADRFSHAVRKQPAVGDFRVQMEHGGTTEPWSPSEATLAVARAVLTRVPGPWLYARVDGVEVDGVFLLMELELIEPSLFLDADPAAPARFAKAIAAAL